MCICLDLLVGRRSLQLWRAGPSPCLHASLLGIANQDPEACWSHLLVDRDSLSSISLPFAGTFQFCGFHCSRHHFLGPKYCFCIQAAWGRTKVKYALSLSRRDFTRRLRLTNLRVPLALLVTLPIWWFQFKSLGMCTPRYFAFLTSFSTLPCRVYW